MRKPWYIRWDEASKQAKVQRVIACLATFSTINFFVFGLAIVLMAGSAPTTFKLTEHLNLSPNEVRSLEAI